MWEDCFPKRVMVMNTTQCPLTKFFSAYLQTALMIIQAEGFILISFTMRSSSTLPLYIPISLNSKYSECSKYRWMFLFFSLSSLPLYTSICIYISVYMHTAIYVQVHVYIKTFTQVHAYVRMCVYTYSDIHHKGNSTWFSSVDI